MGYSIKQKIDICLMAESNPEMTQHDLAHWAKVRYGSTKSPSQTTISRILAKKDEFISLKEHEFKLIRRRRLSNPLLRKILLEWIAQNVWNNIPISPPIILSSAGNFWKQIPENLREGNGEFTYRWCSQFLSKVNIQLNNVESELYNRLKVWTSQERNQIKTLLAEFDPRKIFTLSEVFLSHDLPLDKAYYADHSDFLSCMICVNVDGSEKFDPLIIGRYENYPSFEGRTSARLSASHGVSYHSNKQKWLTSTMFYDWLSVLDKRLALSNRDIVLILDDSASHRVINIKLERIRLLFTSSTPGFSPMHWGIEHDFRLNFRIQQYKRLLSRQRVLGGQILKKEQQEFSMIETFDLIKESWGLVPENRIKSAWKKSGILPDAVTQLFAKFKLFDNKLESELALFIEELNVIEKWNILELLDLSVEQKINRTFLSNSEIIDSCIVENYNDVSHTEGENQRAPYSHELGKPLARLQRLGERLNSATALDAQMMEFEPFDFYPNGSFDLNNPNMEFVDQEALTSVPNFRLPELQPMSELVSASDRDLGNQIFLKDEFMEVEVPWSDIFPVGMDTPSTTMSTGTYNIQGANEPALVSPPENSEFALPSNLEYFNQVTNLSSNEKLSIVTNLLNLAQNDQGIQLSESTLNELRNLQSIISQQQ